MTKVTLQATAIRGKLTIEANEMNSDQFRCSGNAYNPFTFEAESLGHAINHVMQNLHKLQANAQSASKSEARSKRMKERWASGVFSNAKLPKVTSQDKTKPVPSQGAKSA